MGTNLASNADLTTTRVASKKSKKVAHPPVVVSALSDEATNVIHVPNGKLVDYLDGRTLRPAKPEEFVRQTILKTLVNTLRFPRARVQAEKTIAIGSSKKRVDVAVYKNEDNKSQENIWIVVECKNEKVAIDDKNDGVGQLKSYMAACLSCEWGWWTNGIERKVFRKIVGQDGKHEFQEVIDIPSAQGEKPAGGRKRNELDRGLGDILLFAFKAAHNAIVAVDGFQNEKAFFELLKIIFCKIQDEKNIPHPLEFYVRPEELNDPNGQAACHARIGNIFEAVKTKFPKIFAEEEKINLKPGSLVRIVKDLQNYTMLSTDIDIKGKAYEEIVGANLKGDRGQYFTPRNVMNMAVAMINPKEGERVLDPTCGTGGFLVSSMLHVLKPIEAEFSRQIGAPRARWANDEQKAFNDRIAELAASSFFGFDISPDLVKSAKMNMVMNNDGSGNMLDANSLLPPHRWSAEFRSELAAGINRSQPAGDKIRGEKLLSHKDLALFDVILTNPPFGKNIKITDAQVLEQYDLGHIWSKPKKPGQRWIKGEKTQASVPPEQLFIERCIQFLKPGGRMAMVVPDAILGSPGTAYIRQWLMDKTKVIASVDLHQDTFQPFVGVQSSILIVQKKTDEELREDLERGFQLPITLFVANVKKVGHDKRGNVSYLRDKAGQDIYTTVKEETTLDDGTIIEETRTERTVDDQTGLVPGLFVQWKEREGLSW